jgi:hypothetical protein
MVVEAVDGGQSLEGRTSILILRNVSHPAIDTC